MNKKAKERWIQEIKTWPAQSRVFWDEISEAARQEFNKHKTFDLFAERCEWNIISIHGGIMYYNGMRVVPKGITIYDLYD